MLPKNYSIAGLLLVFLFTQGICPSSTWALRVQNAGMEENPTRKELSTVLRPSGNLEEPPQWILKELGIPRNPTVIGHYLRRRDPLEWIEQVAGVLSRHPERLREAEDFVYANYPIEGDNPVIVLESAQKIQDASPERQLAWIVLHALSHPEVFRYHQPASAINRREFEKRSAAALAARRLIGGQAMEAVRRHGFSAGGWEDILTSEAGKRSWEQTMQTLTAAFGKAETHRVPDLTPTLKGLFQSLAESGGTQGSTLALPEGRPFREMLSERLRQATERNFQIADPENPVLQPTSSKLETKVTLTTTGKNQLKTREELQRAGIHSRQELNHSVRSFADYQRLNLETVGDDETDFFSPKPLSPTQLIRDELMGRIEESGTLTQLAEAVQRTNLGDARFTTAGTESALKSLLNDHLAKHVVPKILLSGPIQPVELNRYATSLRNFTGPEAQALLKGLPGQWESTWAMQRTFSKDTWLTPEGTRQNSEQDHFQNLLEQVRGREPDEDDPAIRAFEKASPTEKRKKIERLERQLPKEDKSPGESDRTTTVSLVISSKETEHIPLGSAIRGEKGYYSQPLPAPWRPAAGLEEISEAVQGPGVLVIGLEGLEIRTGLEELVRQAPQELLKRMVFYAVGTAWATRLKESNPGVRVISSNDLTDLATLLLSMPEAEQVTVLGALTLAQQLQQLLVMSVSHLDANTDFRLILAALGVPADVLDQIDAAGLEENLSRSRAA